VVLPFKGKGCKKPPAVIAGGSRNGVCELNRA